MSYSATEISATGGKPIELYEFIGTYTNYYYTSSDTNVLYGGQVYISIPIQRASITTGTQVDDTVDCQITLPYDEQICMDYAYSGISAPGLSLNIWRYHLGEDPNVTAILYWSGQVTNFLANGHEVTIQVPTFFSYALTSEVPNICYQTFCNHVLFDSRCKVLRTTYSLSSTIQTISGTNLVVADELDFAVNFLIGGEIVVSPKNERRMIIGNEGSTITLSYPFSKNVAAGAAIQIASGCNHIHSGDCKTKYANGLNFGGFPYIPTTNPFTGLF